MSFILFAVITQLVTIAALACYPYRRPDLFRLAPSIFGVRVRSIPLITLSAVCSILYLLWVLYAIIRDPDTVAISNLWITLGLFVLIVVLGAVIFLIADHLRKKRYGVGLNQRNQGLPYQ